MTSLLVQHLLMHRPHLLCDSPPHLTLITSACNALPLGACMAGTLTCTWEAHPSLDSEIATPCPWHFFSSYFGLPFLLYLSPLNRHFICIFVYSLSCPSWKVKSTRS